MATIDLSRYTSAKKSSILGYSATAGWSLGNSSGIKTPAYDPVLTWAKDGTDVTTTAVEGVKPLTINAITNDNWVIDDTKGAAKTINTGSGGDTVTVATADAVVSTGNGNDKVSVVGNLDGANINLGAGTDTLDLTKGAVKVEKSTIQLGAGVAVVDGATTASFVGSTFNGTGANTINLNKLDESRINLGSGADVVSVTTTASSNTFVMGAGNDKVTITGASTENNFDLGAGDDSVSLAATSTSDTVTMGAGTDKVSVKGDAAGTKFDMGAGDDLVSLGANAKEVTITAGDGADVVTVTSNVESSTLEMGAGKDSVTLGGTAKDTTINAGDGDDSISVVGLVTDGKINAGAGDDGVTLAGGAKNTTIDLGAGKDTVSITGDGSDSSITGGAAADVFDVTGLSGGTATITDFQATTDLLVHTTALKAADLKADGTISLASGGVVQLSSSAGYYAVTADTTSAGTTKQNILWTGEKAVEINASAINEPMLIVGTTGEGADTLRGGKKADEIVAGAGDVVFGGGGDDNVTLGAAADDKRETVALVNGAGADSVSDFEQGFAATKDVIYLAENSIDDIAKASAFDATTTPADLYVKLGTSKLQLVGVSATTSADLNVVDKSNKEYDVAVVGNNTTYGGAAVTDVESMADYYIAIGDAAGLNFSSISDTLTIELGNTGVYGGSSTFVGNFDSVTGGTTNTVIIGAGNKKETLTAQAGLTSLWGGGSAADSLIGAGATAGNKTTFFYRAGDGKDTVNGTNWGNGSDADVLDLTGVTMTSIKKDATTGMVISTNSDADKLTVQGVATENDVVKFTLDGTTVLQGKYGITDGTVTNNFTYDSNVSVYYGGKSDTLTVGSGITEANIQLDGSQGVGYAGITTVDASGNNGSIIIGGTGTANESIMAGTGSSSIWGGAGSSKDTLVGSGSGSTTFYWGTDNGNDTISSTTSSDKVFFYNISSTAGTVTDIKDTVDSDGTMVFTLASGEKLTLTGLNASAVTQFTFADGATYTYNYGAEAGKRWSVA